MEDIRKACALSRGGLYHHFGNKGAILEAVVVEEIDALAAAVERSEGSPIETLLKAGSTHLGNDPGVVTALTTREEKLVYLSALDQAIAHRLSATLGAKLSGSVRRGVDPADVAELFLTVNAHLNRRRFLGEWTDARAATFAATALSILVPLLKDATGLRRIIDDLRRSSTR